MVKKIKVKDQRPRPIASGVFLLGLGLWFLIFDLQDMDRTWPALIIVVGLAVIFKHFAGRRSEHVGPPPPPPADQV